MKIKYSLKKDYPEWSKTINIEELKDIDDTIPSSIDILHMKENIDTIILTIEQNEHDEVVAFEIKGN